MTSQKRLLKTSPDHLKKEEWQFTNIPDEERFACVCYEFARESERVKHDVKIWLKYFPWGTPWPDWKTISEIKSADSETLSYFYFSKARIALVSPDFPKLAWLLIPAEPRRTILKDLNWQEEESKFDFQQRSRSEGGLARFAPFHFDVTNWGYSDNELIDQFRSWIKATRPKHLKSYSPFGRPSEILGQLGLFRIARYARAHGIPRAKATKESPGEHPNSTYSRARAAVKKFQDTFY